MSKRQPKTTPPRATVQHQSSQDWRATLLAEVRHLILAADPEVIEEQKWAKATNPTGVPIWSHDGIVCTGETYKHSVKLTFARGAALADPHRLFNSSLEGNTRRAIDLREGDQLDAAAFQQLVLAAVAENQSARSAKTKATSPAPAKKPSGPTAEKTKSTGRKIPREPVKLLTGGNPQIAKADGVAPVEAYIAAMPGWKRNLGERLDALIVQQVPHVRKAVKWNSPFYGIEGQGWFLSFHVFTRYVKVTFFDGTSLRPVPPGGTEKSQAARWIDLYEDQPFDEPQLAKWVKQAAVLPGWLKVPRH